MNFNTMQAFAGTTSAGAPSCRLSAASPSSRALPHSMASLSFEGLRRISPKAQFAVSQLSARRMSSRRRSSVIVEAKAGARKVALLGAAGGIGQPLALLLKMQPLVAELSLYDIANTVGVAADLSHCNTTVKVTGHTGQESLGAALEGADLVVIPAGVPRKPGMTRDDLFNINASIVKTLAEGVAKFSPQAVIAIISNPVNSTVPITAEVLKKAGVYDPRKVLGVTTLDVVRANTFVSEAKGLPTQDVDVPVVGGHAGITILPLLSQTNPPVSFTDEEAAKLTDRIQNAGTEVVEAKAGAGSATLSMAYAAARFAESVLRGLEGEANVYEAAFVESKVTELPFFASKVRLGPNGAEEVLPLGKLTPYEEKGVADLIPVLKKNIDTGIEFANK